MIITLGISPRRTGEKPPFSLVFMDVLGEESPFMILIISISTHTWSPSLAFLKKLLIPIRLSIATSHMPPPSRHSRLHPFCFLMGDKSPDQITDGLISYPPLPPGVDCPRSFPPTSRSVQRNASPPSNLVFAPLQ